MRILSLFTLLLYSGLLFPTAAAYVNNKLVELQNKHQLFTFAVQAATGQSSKCLNDQADDDDVLPAAAQRPSMTVVHFAADHSPFAPLFFVGHFPFAARAPPA